MALPTINQLLRDSGNKPLEDKLIKLVVVTTAGLILTIDVPKMVEDKLFVNENPPGFFLSSANIIDYMIAPIYLKQLSRKHGPNKAEEMIVKLRHYLETCKSKSLIDNKTQRLTIK